MSIGSITIEQIKEHCPCVKDSTDEYLEAMLQEFDTLVATMLCRTKGKCPTLGRTDVQEEYPIPCGSLVKCGCKAGIKIVDLFYPADEIEDLKVYVVKDYYTYEEVIEIPEDKWYFSVRTGTLRVDLNGVFPNCMCECSEATLLIDYSAGMDELPDCLFPLLCEMLTVLQAYNVGCGTVEECCNQDKKDLDSYLKAYRMGELSYEYGKDKDSFAYIFNNLFIKNKLSLLQRYSLCGLDSDDYLTIGSDSPCW